MRVRPNSNKPYVVPFVPGTSGSYGYALINARFKPELDRGALQPSMLHALMRITWQEESPDLSVSLAMPNWLAVKGEAPDSSWFDIFIGEPVNGSLRTHQERITGFGLSPGQRFTLAFVPPGASREKYSAFHYNNGSLVCWLLDCLLIVPQTKQVFKANPFLEDRLLELP